VTLIKEQTAEVGASTALAHLPTPRLAPGSVYRNTLERNRPRVCTSTPPRGQPAIA
jgi:hypothetical protein